MDLLLDTHALIWYFDGSPMLSETARAAIDDVTNSIYLSSASFVEMGIKASLGKLQLSVSALELLDSYQDNGAGVIHVEPRHGIALQSLPFHHRDPFDRLLAVQATADNMALVSRDTVFDQYGISRIW